MSTVEEYDPKTETWTRKADMPTPRCHMSISAVNGRIYAIGGWHTKAFPSVSVVEEYDPMTDVWREVADMPTRRGSLSNAVVDGKLYAIGGYGVPGQVALSTVEEYDPEGLQAVSSQGKMPTKWGKIKSD